MKGKYFYITATPEDVGRNIFDLLKDTVGEQSFPFKYTPPAPSKYKKAKEPRAMKFDINDYIIKKPGRRRIYLYE